MGAIAKLAEKCQKCPRVEKCDHKRMEACAYFDDRNLAELVTDPSTADVASPILREPVNAIVNGQVVKIYKDEIERALYKNLYDGLRCGFINGA